MSGYIKEKHLEQIYYVKKNKNNFNYKYNKFW